MKASVIARDGSRTFVYMVMFYEQKLFSISAAMKTGGRQRESLYCARYISSDIVLKKNVKKRGKMSKNWQKFQ